jgi:hypothetical protein
MSTHRPRTSVVRRCAGTGETSRRHGSEGRRDIRFIHLEPPTLEKVTDSCADSRERVTPRCPRRPCRDSLRRAPAVRRRFYAISVERGLFLSWNDGKHVRFGDVDGRSRVMTRAAGEDASATRAWGDGRRGLAVWTMDRKRAQMVESESCP